MNWNIQYLPEFSANYSGGETVVTVSFRDSSILALALSALKEGVADKVRFFADNGGITLSGASGRTTAVCGENGRKLLIGLGGNDLEYLLHFTMTGLVQGYFDVDHVDVAFADGDEAEAGTLVFKFSPGSPPLQSGEARRLLGL